MRDDRDEIRARLSIVDLVGQRVALKKAGRHWKGLCPFHNDRNPSFYVSEETGTYKCWSCGEWGDLFKWVMKTQKVEFPEALEILAKLAGVTLSRHEKRDRSERDLQLTIMDEARAFFSEQLRKTPDAMAYCLRRGLDEHTLQTWELGYAPELDIALTTFLQKKGYPLAEVKTLFLADQDAGGGYFDKFRARLMFPIRNERGDLVAFGGRLLGDGVPKYINSGDTPLFRKHRVLYGLHRAKNAMNQSNRAVLVEGYLDVIACHRAGVESAVASLGTSLTEEHAALLKRWCAAVTVLYDSDNAGQKAAEKACDILKEAGLDVSVALMPPGEDPDTLLKTAGPEAVQMAVQGGLTATAFRVRQVESRLRPDQPEFWPALTQVLASSESLREIELLAADLSRKYLPGQSPEAGRGMILADVRRLRRPVRRGSARPQEESTRSSPLSPAEATVFRAVLDEHRRKEAWPFLEEDGLLVGPTARRLSLALREAFEGPPSGPAAEWLHQVEDEDLREVLGALPMTAGLEPVPTREALEHAVGKLRKARKEWDLEAVKRQEKDSGDARLAEIQARLNALKGE